MSLTQFANLHVPRLRPGVRFNLNVWQPGDGPSFGIFEKMPAGSRFIGSRKLATAHGMLTSRDIGLGPDDLDGYQIAAYLDDVIAQGRAWNRMQLFQDTLARQKLAGAAPDQGACALVADLTEGNLEVVWPLDPPARLFVDIRAPGWDELAAVL